MLDREQLIQIQEQYKKDHKEYGKHDEHSLQVSLMRYVRLQYKHCKFFSIPNAGKRSRFERSTMLSEGLLSGVPDTFLAYPNKKYAGLWIELKNGKKGIVSPMQKEMIEYLNSVGYKAIVCRTFDEAKEAIDSYMAE